MNNSQGTILIMAGGTGGHIFPALSIAEKLQEMGLRVEWLGSKSGLEVQILGKSQIPLHLISARGLRGKNFSSLITAPFMIVQATVQAMRIIKQVNPDCVLGMGGFVTGPGGVAARLRGKKLLVHEQNAVPGITNKLLAPLAYRVLQAFPGTFKGRSNVETVGNPVRKAISSSAIERNFNADRPVRMLVLGGSQGAQAINQLVPAALGSWPGESGIPEIKHQTGKNKLIDTVACYARFGIETSSTVTITEFIDDMASAYQWADLVICRSGASTVAELAASGVPSVLIPYPYHKDQQQLENAHWLADAGAALILEQKELTANQMQQTLFSLAMDRSRLSRMARAARDIAIVDADIRIGRYCQELVNG